MPNYEDKTKHRVDTLNFVNDAEAFVIVTDNNVSLRGDHIVCVASVASALASNKTFRKIIIDAIDTVSAGIKEDKP